MKFNIANPATGAQMMLEIDDERRLQPLWDKRLAQEVPGETLGDQFKGYVFKITGGMDKQGFAMKQGVQVPHRVRLLLNKDSGLYRPPRDGCRRRKSVRGCIVAHDISVLNLIITKNGPEPLPVLSTFKPRRLGPKRATKIRRLFGLDKKDDVRKYVVRRLVVPKVPEVAEGEEAPPKPAKAKKPRSKAPKIQRLVTPRVLQRKRHRLALKKRYTAKTKEEHAAYEKMLASRRTLARASELSKKKVRASQRQSEKKSEKATVTPGEKTAEKASTVKKNVEKLPGSGKPADKLPASKKASEKPAPKKTADKPADKPAAKPAAVKKGAAKKK